MKFPLSQSQQGIYYACVTSSDSSANYQNPVLFDLPADVDLKKVQSAVYEALCAHPSLASRVVVDEEGTPCVESGSFPSMEETVPILKVGSLEEVQPAIGEAMDVHGERLYRCAVYQGPKASWLYVDFHHVLCDGFSIVLMLREIERCFNGKKPAGEQVDGGTLALEEQALREDEAKMAEAREWYAKTFCDAAETDSLPLPQSTQAGVPARMCYTHFPLNIDKEEIQEILGKWNISESTLMQAAWGLLLSAYSAEDKASYCTVYFGRSERRTLSTVTMMVHTIPVFVQVGGDMTLGEVFSALSDQMEKAQSLQFYAYQDAVKDLGINNQVAFVYQGSVLNSKRGLHFGENPVHYEDLRQPAPGWKLSAELFETDGVYSLKIAYDNADYSDSFMVELSHCFEAILHSMKTAEKGLREFMEEKPLSVKIYEIEHPDVPLWAIWAIQQYVKDAGREKGYKMYGKLVKDIVKYVASGGHPNMRLDDNGLLYVNGRDKAVTWMNSTANGRPVVPRSGYIVEFNALWYNALKFCASMEVEFGDKKLAEKLEKRAELCKTSFIETFLNEYGYLLDYVDGSMMDWSVRPNMIFPVAFDYSPLNQDQKKNVLDICTRELLTPKGLRSLSPKSGGYNPMYVGPQTQRDYAYHQGTAWPWLGGFYMEACLKLYKRTRLSFIERQLVGYEDEMMYHAVGTISELFDGNPPFHGRGAMAFAMNVAEILRTLQLMEKYTYQK